MAGSANGQPPTPTSRLSSAKLQAFMTKPSDVNEFVLGDWTMRTVKDRIMQSTCQHQQPNAACDVCIYGHRVPLASLPDMVFSKNQLVLRHQASGAKIEFNSLNALEMVDAQKSDPSLKVAETEIWRSARAELMQTVVKKDVDFDWTYTSKYKGHANGFEICPTTDRIDMNALRIREPILFYDELSLYEDELDDHGCARMSVRVRCMPSGYFVLLRYYLRIDGVVLRMYDTRLRCTKSAPNEVLREWTAREQFWKDMPMEIKDLAMQPDVIWEKVPVVEEVYEKLVLTKSF